MRRAILLLLTLSITVPALSAAPPQEPSDEKVRAAWSKLNGNDKKQIAMWFEAEAERLDSYQNTLIKWIMGTIDHDPRDWPEAKPAPLYDAAHHAPQQPTQRHYVAPDSRLAKSEVERLFAAVPKRSLDPAFRYDWARRSVVHCADRRDPERIFQNGFCLLYTSPSPRDLSTSRMPSSA